MKASYDHLPWVWMPEGLLSETPVALLYEEAQHVTRVLRCHSGDTLVGFDGEGRIRLGHLEVAQKQKCVLHWEEPQQSLVQDSVVFQWIPALPNAVVTFEELLRKMCELGVQLIRPVLGERSEKKHWTLENWNKRKERWQRILIDGCKQAKNPFLPKILFPSKLTDLDRESVGMCFYGSLNSSLEKLSRKNLWKEPFYSCIIGPEGGFSKEEEQFLDKISIGVRLPTNVLRVETATVGLLSFIKAQHQLMGMNYAS